MENPQQISFFPLLYLCSDREIIMRADSEWDTWYSLKAAFSSALHKVYVVCTQLVCMCKTPKVKNLTRRRCEEKPILWKKQWWTVKFENTSEVNISFFKAHAGIMDTVSQLSMLNSPWFLDFSENFWICQEKNENEGSGRNLVTYVVCNRVSQQGKYTHGWMCKHHSNLR